MFSPVVERRSQTLPELREPVLGVRPIGKRLKRPRGVASTVGLKQELNPSAHRPHFACDRFVEARSPISKSRLPGASPTIWLRYLERPVDGGSRLKIVVKRMVDVTLQTLAKPIWKRGVEVARVQKRRRGTAVDF